MKVRVRRGGILDGSVSSDTGSGTPMNGGERAFPNTRWSLVLAGPRAADAAARRAALEELAKSYWGPIRAYVRARWSRSQADAEDGAQAFFAWMLASDFLERATPERGRFRSYVKTALEHFLTDAERKRQALKRGGGRMHVPIAGGGAGAEDAEDGALELADPSGRSPEDALDEAWRAELLERAAERLERELVDQGKAAVFAVFRDYFLTDSELDYAALAQRHGIAPTNVSNYLALAKKRYRWHLRNAVMETVHDSEGLALELRWLLGEEG